MAMTERQLIGQTKAKRPRLPKPPRDSLPPGANLCDSCTAKCCRYIALPIATPTTWNDFDDIRWYLSHEDISVFVDEGCWYLMVHRECRHLQADNRCGIYDDRPRVCRDYTTEKCEYEDDYTYPKIFETDDQIADYAEALLGPKPAPVEPPTLLPILSGVMTTTAAGTPVDGQPAH